jgi:hypothetical protein
MQIWTCLPCVIRKSAVWTKSSLIKTSSEFWRRVDSLVVANVWQKHTVSMFRSEDGDSMFHLRRHLSTSQHGAKTQNFIKLTTVKTSVLTNSAWPEFRPVLSQRRKTVHLHVLLHSICNWLSYIQSNSNGGYTLKKTVTWSKYCPTISWYQITIWPRQLQLLMYEIERHFQRALTSSVLIYFYCQPSCPSVCYNQLMKPLYILFL